MSIALYRKYRSKRLSEVVGQEHVTDVLERALKAGSISHAYLLTGPRGTGKTSVARILAHEITGLPYAGETDHLDIIEIDAASNNGVDDVRNLRDKALIAPSSAPKKIYIIDEVHMLSKAAFNALLKVLEEPPQHVVFILATTDVDKVPDTIMSRTQRYHFHFIDDTKVINHLRTIAQKETIAINDDALELIAVRGGGSFRDSISLLDQLRHSADGEITRSTVEATLGLASHEEIESLITTLDTGSSDTIITLLRDIQRRGISATTIASQLRGYIHQHIGEHPELIHYLERLSDVAKSHHPDITLLVALLEHITKKPSNTPPQDQRSPKNSAAVVRKIEKVTATAPSSKPAIKKTSVTAPKVSQDEINQEQPPAAFRSISPEDFDWKKVLDYASTHKDQFIGVHSLLAKCTPDVSENNLRLYAGNKFNKSKLDSTRNRTIISKILREIGIENAEIVTIASPPPPKDERAAQIAAMMGGGEEVDVS